MKKADYHRKRPGVLVRFQGDQITRVKEAAARECLAVETWVRQKCMMAANMTTSLPLLDGAQSKRLAKKKKNRLARGGSRKKGKLKQARKAGWTLRPRGDRKNVIGKDPAAGAGVGVDLVKPG